MLLTRYYGVRAYLVLITIARLSQLLKSFYEVISRVPQMSRLLFNSLQGTLALKNDRSTIDHWEMSNEFYLSSAPTCSARIVRFCGQALSQTVQLAGIY